MAKPMAKYSRTKYLFELPLTPNAAGLAVEAAEVAAVGVGTAEGEAPKVRDDLNDFPCTLIFFLIQTKSISPRAIAK